MLLPLPFDASLDPRTRDRKLRLLHASVIVRHGLRTPLSKVDDVEWDCSTGRVLHLHEFDEIDGPPHARASNELFVVRNVARPNLIKGSCYPGQLTRLGFHQHLALGALLRARYVEELGLLPAFFSASSGSLFVRTTWFERTLSSAEALLNGLYPPVFRAGGTNGQIVISTNHDFFSDTMHIAHNCAEVREHSRKVQRSARRFRMGPIEGDTASSDFITTMDTLLLHGHPLPRDAPNVEEVHRSAARDHAAWAGRADLMRVAIGRFVGELWDGVRGPHKLCLYSAHDSTLIPLLGLLTEVDPAHGALEHPPCASSLAVELYEEVDDPQRARHVLFIYNAAPMTLRGIETSLGPGWYREADVSRLMAASRILPEEFAERCRGPVHELH